MFSITFLFVVLISTLFVKDSASVQLDVNPRIVGGDNVDILNFPYQVSLQYAGEHFCGGSLIYPDIVLSAGHCFGSSMPVLNRYFQAVLGRNNTYGSGGQSVQMCSVTVHEGFNMTTLDSDLSIIKLCSNATLNNAVQTIELSDSDNYTENSYAVVSGWGYEQENGNLSATLRAVSVPITSREYCLNAYGIVINITRNMICAGFQEGGKDACQGDSGGPLVWNNKLIGVVSFGMGCALKNYPGVYANVANLKRWINLYSIGEIETTTSTTTLTTQLDINISTTTTTILTTQLDINISAATETFSSAGNIRSHFWAKLIVLYAILFIIM